MGEKEPVLNASDGSSVTFHPEQKSEIGLIRSRTASVGWLQETKLALVSTSRRV